MTGVGWSERNGKVPRTVEEANVKFHGKEILTYPMYPDDFRFAPLALKPPMFDGWCVVEAACLLVLSFAHIARRILLCVCRSHDSMTTTTEPVRVALTGCSTGIGRALAMEFSRRGCIVLATARKLESIMDMKDMGIHVAAADVCSPASLVKAIEDFGTVDICVANAGISGFAPLIDQDLECIDRVLRTNVTGVVATAQAVASGMIEKKSGLLVVVGSVSGAMVTPFAGTYCASKAAVTALCDAMRMELAPLGVGVLEVITGSIKSNFSVNASEASKLPKGSRYASLQKFVDARVYGSQGSQAVDAAEYARVVVNVALSPNRLRHTQLVAGGMARQFHLIGKYMPRRMWASSVSKKFGLNLLVAADASGQVAYARASVHTALAVGGVAALAIFATAIRGKLWWA